MELGKDEYGGEAYFIDTDDGERIRISHNHLNGAQCERSDEGEGCFWIDDSANGISFALTDEGMQELFMAYLALRGTIKKFD